MGCAVVLVVGGIVYGSILLGTGCVRRHHREAVDIVKTACGPEKARIFDKIEPGDSRDTAHNWAEQCVLP